MAESGNENHLERRIEELGRELARVSQRLQVLEREIVRLSPAVSTRTDAPDPQPELTSTRSASPSGGLSTVLGRAAVACFLLAVALVLRTLADSQLLSVSQGIWLGLGYVVMLNVAGWGLYRRDAGQAPTYCVTGAVLLGAVLVEGVFRHGVVPLPVAYGLLTLLAAGTGWTLRDRTARWTIWAVGAALLGVGSGLLFAKPPLPWAAALMLVGNAMAGRSITAPGRLLFRAAAWLALVALWGVWGMELSGAMQGGADVPARLAPDWFAWILLATLLYFLCSSVVEVARQPRRWLDAFDACLLPLTVGWGHLVGWWVLSQQEGAGHWLGWLELGAACLILGAAWILEKRGTGRPQGAAGTGLLVVSAAVLLFLGMPTALGGVAAVALWAVSAYGLARLGRRWQSGGARLASYLLPAAGCAYGWFSPGLVPGGSPWIAVGPAFAVAATAALFQYAEQRRWTVPEGSRFFASVDPRDDTGALPLLAAVGFGVLAVRGFLHPLLAGFLADPTEALSSAQSVMLSLSALALIVDGQRRGHAQERGVGALVLAISAVRVFCFDLLASSGIPLVLSVVGFGVAAGVAAVALRRPVGATAASGLESESAEE